MQMSPSTLWKKLSILLFSLIISVSVINQSANAAKVYKTKKRRIYLKLDGEIVSKGDTFYIYDKKGKKRGRVRVYKVKGNKAYAKLKKGKAKKGWRAKMKSYALSKKISKDYRKTDVGTNVGGTTFWGIIGGLSSNTGAVKIEASNKTVSLTGTGFSLKGLFDYGIFQNVWFRGTAGLQGFNIGGATDPNCTGGVECKANINYISFDFLARYIFSLSSFRPWIGAGFSVLFPASNEVTVFKSESVTNTNLYVFGGGVDWFMSSTSFIPISFEYSLFPEATNVSANSIDIRIGYGMEF